MGFDLRLLTGQPCEMAALQRLLDNAPAYAEHLNGHPSEAADAQSLFSTVPPGVTYDNKYLYGFMIDGPAMVGCVDIIRGWPAPGTVLIALLLLDEAHQDRGFGETAYHAVEEKVRRWPEIDTIRVRAVRSNDAALPFWLQMGFAKSDEVHAGTDDQPVSESIGLAKPLN